VDQLRRACAEVAQRARSVRINAAAIPCYAASLQLHDVTAGGAGSSPEPDLEGSREQRSAFWLTLDAVNFGSGWFPTLAKTGGSTGYQTISSALAARYRQNGPWTAIELGKLTSEAAAVTFGQRPDHELMELFARSLNDLGGHVALDYGGSFAAVVDAARGSAPALARELGSWRSYADCSRYDELEIPFLKRAQIAAADLQRAGVVQFDDIDRLTMFADNLVPHVLSVDGILEFDPDLAARINRGALIEHDSREEIEIRACALQCVELIVSQRPDANAAQVDQHLWQRGQSARYKSAPRHRSRCTAY
jgi:hypothetical protein